MQLKKLNYKKGLWVQVKEHYGQGDDGNEEL